MSIYKVNKKYMNKIYRTSFYVIYVKRFLDILCSLLGIIILSPIFLIIMILVRIKLGSPVIFRQRRPGLNEKIFTLYKFRTMTNEKNSNGELLADEVRLTKFGKWLRSTSLDELPELFNILKGDMSIVGPRPLAVQYLPYYSETERHRHDVLPGLTGLAQVNGRNSLIWEEKFSYDLAYVKNVSFSGDIKIIFATIKTVLSRSDIGVRGLDTPLDFDLYRKGEMETDRYENCR